MSALTAQQPSSTKQVLFNDASGRKTVSVPSQTAPARRMQELRPRQIIEESSLSSVCGYISANACRCSLNCVTPISADCLCSAYPMSCDKRYCAFNYLFSALGCCKTYHITTSSQVVLDACSYQIACVDGFEPDGNCDEACQSNDLIMKW